VFRVFKTLTAAIAGTAGDAAFHKDEVSLTTRLLVAFFFHENCVYRLTGRQIYNNFNNCQRSFLKIFLGFFAQLLQFPE
jgi:hypothetical protein